MPSLLARLSRGQFTERLNKKNIYYMNSRGDGGEWDKWSSFILLILEPYPSVCNKFRLSDYFVFSLRRTQKMIYHFAYFFHITCTISWNEAQSCNCRWKNCLKCFEDGWTMDRGASKTIRFLPTKKKHEGRSILTFVINAYSIKYWYCK